MNFDTDATTQRGGRLAEPRTFILAGREFTYAQSVSASALDEFRAIAATDTDGELWALFDRTMENLLEPGQIDKWREATAPGTTVTWRDVMEVINWIAGRVVGRPPTPSSDSSGSSTNGEASSPDVSSLREPVPEHSMS